MDTLWAMEDIAERIEPRRPQPGKRGPYAKREAVRAVKQWARDLALVGIALIAAGRLMHVSRTSLGLLALAGVAFVYAAWRGWRWFRSRVSN
ncbi:MAG TPA: hypothetical protein VGI30_10845 [Caulobacteraceae bacterium]